MSVLVLLIFYFVLCYIVGTMGDSRKIGFGGAFLLSFVFSPLIGAVITFMSADLREEKFRVELLNATHAATQAATQAAKVQEPTPSVEVEAKTEVKTVDEKVLFMTEISEIRNLLFQCHRSPNLLNFKLLFNDKRVHHTHLIEQSVRQQITKGTFDKSFLSKSELMTLQNALLNFYNRLYIK